MTITQTITHESPILPADAAERPGRTTPLQFSPLGLWLRGAVVAVTAILTIIAVTLLVRGFLSLDAFEGPAPAGTPGMGPLSAGACVATLLSVLALHILLRTTTRPFSYLTAVMIAGYFAFIGVTVSSGLSGSQMVGALLVCAVVGVIIRPLVGWAGHASLTEQP